MGTDAKVKIWIGLNLQEDEFSDMDVPEIIDGINEEWREKFITAWDNYDAVEVEGVKIQFFTCSNDDVGLGAKLFSHDWDYGVVEFDPIELLAKATELLPRVEKAFKTAGIEKPPKIFLQTDCL